MVESRSPGSSCFVALADFSAGRWVFNARNDLPDSGLTAAPALGPIDPAKHEDGDGNYFAAIAVPVGSHAAVHSMQGIVITNDPPVAALSASPLQADAPVSISYDASASSDIDGSIIQYEWDMQGDGIFELNTGTVPSHSVLHASPAVVDVTVRVTDDDGATATASTQALVTQNGNVPPIAVLTSDVSEGDGEAGFSAQLFSD
ncbi:PKD domain-containing protein [bacterium]|nr:PKD domain-containing protein [bacterium]